MFCYYSYSFLLYKVVYLYLICYYLKSKIRAVDRQVIHAIKFSRYEYLRRNIYTYYKIYSEINEYNTTFWSKYLFVFWLTFDSVIVFLIICIFFIPLPLLYKITWIISVIFHSAIFSVVIFSTSSLNSVSIYSYKIVNKAFIYYSRLERKKFVLNDRKVITKIKVSFIY